MAVSSNPRNLGLMSKGKSDGFDEWLSWF
jgi:hypothetical protein